nr:DUF6571 family protein [Allostreptomyces psammosilenae]
MNHRQLLEADVAKLEAAAAAWGRVAEGVRSLDERMEAEVIGPMTTGGWTGEAQGYAHDRLRQQDEQLTAACTEATAIEDTLRWAAEEIGRLRTEMEAVVSDVAAAGLTLESNGDITWNVPPEAWRQDPEQAERTNQEFAASAGALRAEMDRILGDAAAVDDEAATKLREHSAGQDGVSFNASAIGDRQALAELRRALELTGRGAELSPEEFEELNSLLEGNADDPAFATALMNQLGPQGLLNYYSLMGSAQWGQTTDDPEYIEWYSNMHDLQQNLGALLAAATNTEGVPHVDAAWVTDLTLLGDDQFDVLEPTGTEWPNRPYGYQILSNLMRTGEYDPAFLLPVAEGMTAFEAGDPTAWQPGRGDGGFSGAIILNFSGDSDDWGYDPMTGLMTALSNSPQAATAFFADETPIALRDGGEATNLEYFLSQRQYPQDVRSMWDEQEGVSEFPARDAFGNALQAATTGYPPGVSPENGGYLRTEQTAAIMDRVVDLVADDATRVHPETSDSFAEMGRAYIDQFNNVLASESGGTPLTSDVPMAMSQGQANGYLNAVASYPDGFATLQQAQDVYATWALDQTMANLGTSEYGDEPALRVADTHGLVQGILADGRIEQERVDLKLADQEFNEAIQRRQDLVSGGVELVIGAAETAVPVARNPLIRDVVVPAVTEGISGAVDSLISDGFNSQMRDSSAEAEAYRMEYFESSEVFSTNAVDALRSMHQESGVEQPADFYDLLARTASGAYRDAADVSGGYGFTHRGQDEIDAGG